MDDADRHLFLLQSTHQFIQMAAVAGGQPTGLVHFPTNTAGATAIEAGRALPDAAVDHFVRLEGPLANSGPQRWLTAIRNTRRLRKVLREFRPTDVFISNVQLLEGMALCSLALESPPVRTVNLIEDGFATYEKSSANEPATRRQPLVRRIVAPHATFRPLAQVPFDVIDRLVVWWPELVEHDAWPGVSVTPAGDPERSRRLVQAMGRTLDLQHLDDQVDVLVLPPHSAMTGSAMRSADEVRALVLSLTDAGLRVGMKHHPREDDEYLAGMAGVTTFPSRIPGEVLIARLGATLRWIITERTTLVTTAPVLADATVICVDNGLRPQLAQRLASIGVTVVPGPDEAAIAVLA